MSPPAAPSTALERARIAYDQMKRREYNAAMKQRSRARTRNIALAVTLGVTVALVLGIAIYNGGMPTSLRSSTSDMRADNGGKFGAARTAQVRSHIKGNTCQELQFSNDIGTFVGGSLVPCVAEPKRESVLPLLPGPGASKGARVNSIRDAFKR
jgi:hypothetical protein